MKDNIEELDLCKKLERLMLKYNFDYPIHQKNGQRIFGPPLYMAPPERGTEVFIGKLPRDLFEDELVPVLAKAGRIYMLRMMVDFSGFNRGYAFVTYVFEEDARNAVKTLNNFEIRPQRYIGVLKSVDNRRLFVGGIDKFLTKAGLENEMRRVTEGVRKVIMYQCSFNRLKNRGFAFVEYESHTAASQARRKLLNGTVFIFEDPDIKVDWAAPEHEYGKDELKKSVNPLPQAQAFHAGNPQLPSGNRHQIGPQAIAARDN
ncbi:APOBEC1 complementation factor-like [Oratosquilla oratoria]|uniref:APOBEC1 complementation factor-like n=1 Tax=Oratosquilla oratoria TaxID=337810 RepID=UPI003F759093